MGRVGTFSFSLTLFYLHLLSIASFLIRSFPSAETGLWDLYSPTVVSLALISIPCRDVQSPSESREGLPPPVPSPFFCPFNSPWSAISLLLISVIIHFLPVGKPWSPLRVTRNWWEYVTVWQRSAPCVTVSFLFFLLWWLVSCFLSLLNHQSAYTLEFFMFAGEKDRGGLLSKGCMLQTLTQKNILGCFWCISVPDNGCQKFAPDTKDRQTSPERKILLLKPESHLGIKATLQDELDNILFTV